MGMSIKKCCQDKNNLALNEQHGDLIVHKCKVCGCRHFVLKVDTGKLFSKE